MLPLLPVWALHDTLLQWNLHSTRVLVRSLDLQEILLELGRWCASRRRSWLRRLTILALKYYVMIHNGLRLQPWWINIETKAAETALYGQRQRSRFVSRIAWRRRLSHDSIDGLHVSAKLFLVLEYLFDVLERGACALKELVSRSHVQWILHTVMQGQAFIVELKLSWSKCAQSSLLVLLGWRRLFDMLAR